MAEWSKALVLGTSPSGGVDGLNQKESGGCAEESSSPGCRQRGSKTVCMCADNHCNKQGYDMQDSSEEG
ncbi:Protein CBG11167 [Caenorhabditis briggsae]|uniref:Protein CBG11167 n=1 Tax=Caenorhabditis briggsae TaxID=6238 RepID=A8XCL5_CAEBR|nr:Protein CBG11167 [Caenorhabditis briggsae]CAP30364.1 Protein CBG11167 [Caenorhabditis briggsae]